MRISMPVLGASLLGFLSLSFSISLPTTRPFVSRRECVWEWFSLIWLCTYIHCRGDSLCVCVCVRASNKILCLSHTFEYAFWRFVYLRLPFLSSVFHTCFIPSICLPFTRARRTAEISDIVANKLIYYYSLLGIRHFWRLLSMYNGSYAWYACNWNLLWPAYRNYSSFACWIFTEIARMLRKYLTKY